MFLDIIYTTLRYSAFNCPRVIFKLKYIMCDMLMEYNKTK